MERCTYRSCLLPRNAKNVDDGFGGSSAGVELVSCVFIFLSYYHLDM